MINENDKAREAVKIGLICAASWFVLGPIGLGLVAIYFLCNRKP